MFEILLLPPDIQFSLFALKMKTKHILVLWDRNGENQSTVEDLGKQEIADIELFYILFGRFQYDSNWI